MTEQRENQATTTNAARDREPNLQKEIVRDLEPQETGELIKGGQSCACGGGRGD
jgi:hypothetical protein